MVLEACKQEYQRLHAEHENLKRMYESNRRNCQDIKNITTKISQQLKGKKPNSNIDFDEEKIKKLLSRQARKKRLRYYNDNDDSDAADDEDYGQSDSTDDDVGELSERESVDEEAAAAKKRSKAKKVTKTSSHGRRQ